MSVCKYQLLLCVGFCSQFSNYTIFFIFLVFDVVCGWHVYVCLCVFRKVSVHVLALSLSFLQKRRSKIKYSKKNNKNFTTNKRGTNTAKATTLTHTLKTFLNKSSSCFFYYYHILLYFFVIFSIHTCQVFIVVVIVVERREIPPLVLLFFFFLLFRFDFIYFLHKTLHTLTLRWTQSCSQHNHGCMASVSDREKKTFQFLWFCGRTQACIIFNKRLAIQKYI